MRSRDTEKTQRGKSCEDEGKDYSAVSTSQGLPTAPEAGKEA